MRPDQACEVICNRAVTDVDKPWIRPSDTGLDITIVTCAVRGCLAGLGELDDTCAGRVVCGNIQRKNFRSRQASGVDKNIINLPFIIAIGPGSA